MKIAFYGGSFDPVHRGHVAIAESLLEQFALDAFFFLPAFHAPHKPDTKPTSGYHRYAMLCLATADFPAIRVSQIEMELGKRQFTIDTLPILFEAFPDSEIYFVMGADSWEEIRTWRDWERVLLMTNHIVVTRPGYALGLEHVTDEVRSRIVDLRNGNKEKGGIHAGGQRIYFTDVVNLDISATRIRKKVHADQGGWTSEVPKQVAKYIEKYQIYK